MSLGSPRPRSPVEPEILLHVHLTTVHARADSRIYVKQVQSLQAAFPGEEFALVVADGKGDEPANGQPGIYDLGALDRGRVRRVLDGSLRAFRLIRRIRPRSVHFHDPELIPLGLLLKLSGYRVVYDVHEDMPRQILGKFWLPRPLRYPTALGIGVLERFAGAVFDAIVPATPTIAARFAPEKTVLIRNFPVQAELGGVDTSTYASRPPDFAYVGGVAWIRGAREMVAAIDQLRDRPGACLHLAGPFERVGLEADLAVLAGWQSVRYHGVLGRREVAELLGRVRAGLVLLHRLPNYVDALPIKMFEYMAAGLPVIASDFPLWREILQDGRCGLLVDPEDPAAIAAAMRWILDHPDEAREMGREGRRAVAESYNWERESGRLVELYHRLRSA